MSLILWSHWMPICEDDFLFHKKASSEPVLDLVLGNYHNGPILITVYYFNQCD